ncbi:MAG TPA: tRNA lysidine(34) synthetase TilS [Methylomirabilota bacterium]|nr:tRNA lysidine(34) synthetase TilS [Methylomirabilota bacterium]
MRAKKQQRQRVPRREEPLHNRVLHAVRRQQMLHAGDRVGVAVSGGGDSVALLLLLEALRDELGLVLSVVHFNHQMRGRASDADEKFAAKLAAQRGLAFHVDRAPVAAEAKRARANLEETARRLRYAFFERLAAEGRVDRIAVAHTADDQAETVLAHVLRGTGLAGLGGIHPAAGRVVRPLLGIRRTELRLYLKNRKQPWREDITNRDITRLRARVRRKLLPLLEKQFQPAAVEHLAQLAELAREDEAFLEAAALERVAALSLESGGAWRIAAAALLPPNTPPALAKRIIRKLLERAKTRPGQFNARHALTVLELAQSGRSGSVLQLPGGVDVERSLGQLVFRPRFESEAAGEAAVRSFAYGLEDWQRGASVCVAELGCVFRFRVIDWPPAKGETIEGAAVLDRNLLAEPLVLRSWRSGDHYRPQGRRQSHKLKRLFLEKRVSRGMRATWPVLTSGGAIAWVRGFPVAAEFAPTERTQAGLVIAEEGQ